MENRTRLWAAFKEKLGYVGLGLLLTLGFPLFARLVVKVTSPRLAFLATLERIGWVYVWVAPLLLIALTWWSWHRLRARQRQINTKIATQGETYLLLPRPDALPTRAEKVALWQRLSQVLPRGEHLSFELSGTPQGQAFSLRASDSEVCRAALVQVMTEYPGVEVRRVEAAEEDPLWVGEGQVSVWIELAPSRPDQPLEIATPDPQIALLGELALLAQGMQGGVQVLMREDFHTRGQLMSQAAKATSKKPDTSPYALRPSSADKRDVAYVDDRAQQHFVEVQVLVWAAAPVAGMAWSVVNHLASTLRGQYQSHNPLKVVRQGVGTRYERDMPTFRGVGWSTEEVGTVAHLVGSDTVVLAPQLLRARARALPASPKSCIPSHVRVAPFLAHAQPIHIKAAVLADLVVVVEDDSTETHIPNTLTNTVRTPAVLSRPFASTTAAPSIVIGKCRDVWGESQQVGLPMEDLTTHTCVSGATGSGKSTFLRGMAKQFFELGGTVILIEPHGDLILDKKEGILADLPPECLDRVAVLDFAGPCPPQLNLTSIDLPRGGRSLAVDTAMRSIEVVEAAGWDKGVRIREILENTLHLLLERSQEHASMLDAQIFLMDETRRATWLEEMEEHEEELGESLPYLTQLFKATEGTKGKGADQTLEFPLRRVGRFFRNDYLRRSLALPLLNPKHAFDLDKLMNSGKGAMILVPLRASTLGDDAKRVIATLLMQTISSIFMARGDVAKAERPQTMVMIDEFADLAGTGVGPVVQTLLAQARKFGASVVLATQSLAQLPLEVQTEVRINTNNKIVLRSADNKDAQAGIDSLGTPLLKPNDLLNGMEAWSGYARLLTDGEPQPPFYFQALPPLPMPSRRRARQNNPIPERPLHPKLGEIRGLVEGEPTKAKAALAALVKLSDGEFESVVQSQWEQQEREVQQLLQQPELEPDAVERALRISRAQFGFPWWLYEAQYRRLRFDKKKAR